MNVADEQPLVDAQRLIDLGLVVGEDQVAMLIAAFAADLGRQPAVMRALLRCGDDAAVRDAAHSYRGAALAIGAAHSADAALDVERATADALPACVGRLICSVDATAIELSRRYALA